MYIYSQPFYLSEICISQWITIETSIIYLNDKEKISHAEKLLQRILSEYLL